ncbi:MAG: hydantoinase/oxoprolinase family protein [Desulfomonilia bacterium]
MILGIDIGGTHTDAVCVDHSGIRASAKAITGDDLITSIAGVIRQLDVSYPDVSRVVLSTTLSTNAIIEKKYAPTGMIVSAGPGIDPRHYFINGDFHLVKGAIDHRGREYIPLDRKEVIDVASTLKGKGIRGVGVVSKFSVRNSSHEAVISSLIEKDFQYISLGHAMSGNLAFPRRIYTTYFNAAVMPVQERFMGSVRTALAELGIHAPLLFLKADGGTYSSAAADRLPVETILSGPAASIMGAVALCSKRDATTLVLDVGGTTTDIGVLVGGVPILEPHGVDIGGLKTLVRGLKVVSVGAGGDSAVCLDDGSIRVGPNREGPPLCMGGPVPTPMDAFSVLGEFGTGSPENARRSIQALSDALGRGSEDVARDIISSMVGNIRTASDAFLDEINSHPVYTIYEMLHPDVVKPSQVILIGGPASLLKPYIEEAFGLPCMVPEHAMVANALGAALAKTTAQLTLLADTQLRRLICPELDIEEEIPSRLTLEDLKEIGQRALKENAEFLGLSDSFEVSILEEQSFNMVRGFSTTGKNLRLKLQTRPGILDEWRIQ